MRNWSLRTKILLASSAILVGLIGATLAYVSVQSNRFVGDRIAADLQRTTELLTAGEAERFANLRLTAEILASFPQLRALLGTDAATVRDFLQAYQQRTGQNDLLIALDPNGGTMARTDALAPLEIPDVAARWLTPALGGRPAIGYLVTENGVYQAAVAAAEAGGTVFGYLLAGVAVDGGLAQRLHDATRDEVVILTSDRLLASTIPSDQVPWRTSQDWLAFAGDRQDPIAVSIAGERYAARAARTTTGAPLFFVALQSRDRALEPYRRIQIGLLVLGAFAVAAGVGASAVLARTVTRPVARLAEGTREIAAGNFDFTLDVDRGDEIGALAASFNIMTRGLRERADMQKFVSQSTMKMIESRAKTSAGERRLLTIFFSDIRAFSRFAEERPPEEAVDWLNQCLGLQAELVRKYHGDVDKYVGDAVVALFDGPDMAFDAIRCGVDIHRGMDALNARSGHGPLEVGIAVVTGEVILGSIGSKDRLDYTAIGNQVNLCSRLCSMARPREILLAQSTFALVRDLVAVERLEAVTIRGLAHPVDVYRMVVRPGGSS